MLALTDSATAPWMLLPADDKRRARLALVQGLCDRIEASVD